MFFTVEEHSNQSIYTNKYTKTNIQVKKVYNYTSLYFQYFFFLSSKAIATDFPLTSLPNSAIQMSTPLIFRLHDGLHRSKVLAFYRLSPAPRRRPDPPYSTFFLGLTKFTMDQKGKPALRRLRVLAPPPLSDRLQTSPPLGIFCFSVENNHI